MCFPRNNYKVASIFTLIVILYGVKWKDTNIRICIKGQSQQSIFITSPIQPTIMPYKTAKFQRFKVETITSLSTLSYIINNKTRPRVSYAIWNLKVQMMRCEIILQWRTTKHDLRIWSLTVWIKCQISPPCFTWFGLRFDIVKLHNALNCRTRYSCSQKYYFITRFRKDPSWDLDLRFKKESSNQWEGSLSKK